MGVLPPFITLLVLIAVGHAAAAARAEEPTMVRLAAVVGNNMVVQQAGTTLCCSNMTEYRECTQACFEYYPREQAEKICDPGCQEAYQCLTVSGDKCPNQHPSSADHLINSVAGAREGPMHLAETLCCSNKTGFDECVEDCFTYFPREQAEKICDPGCQEAYQCHLVSGDKCPSGHSSSSSGRLTHAAEKGGNAVEHCFSGCRSSVCNKMVTGKKGVVKLLALERCNKACYKFCTKGGVSRAGTSTA